MFELKITISLDSAIMALLSSAASGAVAAASTNQGNAASSSSAPAIQDTSAAAQSSGNEGGDNAGKRDAAGTIFDPARHTGSVVKSGLWRMKTGLSRPEHESEKSPTYVSPDGAGSASGGASSGSGTQASNTNAQAADEEDEFAAFAAAAGQGSQTQPARNWTDADLAKLANQAAQSRNDPAPVKAIIAKYVPQGQQVHSKSIPNEQREAFAQEVEREFGIQYGG